MEESPLPSSRRRFLLTAILGGVGTALSVAVVWPVWRYLSPPPAAGEKGRMSVARSQVEVGGAYFFQFRGHPAVLLQPHPGEFVAFSAVCTHLGCVIQWQPEKDEFLCPCHAGRFAADGRVLGGPPPKPLEPISVALAGDSVQVG